MSEGHGRLGVSLHCWKHQEPCFVNCVFAVGDWDDLSTKKSLCSVYVHTGLYLWDVPCRRPFGQLRERKAAVARQALLALAAKKPGALLCHQIIEELLCAASSVLGLFCHFIVTEGAHLEWV